MKIPVLGLALGSTLLLAACFHNDNQGPAAGQLLGEVAGWDLGVAGAEVIIAGPAGPVTIASGRIDERGALDITLPGTVDASLLYPLATAIPCQVEVSSDQLKGVVVSSVAVMKQDARVASLMLASSQAAAFPSPRQEGSSRVFWWYADHTASITGTCTEASGEHQFTQRWKLDLLQGWNTVVEQVTELSTTTMTIESRTMDAPPNAKWYFQDSIAPPPQ